MGKSKREMVDGLRKKKDTGPNGERHFFINAQPEREPNNLKSKGEAYPPNRICNQKYSLLSFLPLVFAEQLRHFLNLFFLFVIATQLYEPTRVSHPITSLFPWALVQILVYIKEGYEDYNRYKRDTEANRELCTRFTTSGLLRVPASDLAVGDLILVGKNERVPADSMLLRTEDSSGSLFVRTDQLDGETDWKIKIASSVSQKLPSFESLLQQKRPEVRAEPPSKEIYSFTGSLLIGGTEAAIHEENMLWMNAVIAGGSGVCAVVYTGKDTRAVMNTTQPRSKSGLMDRELNKYTKILCAASFCVAALFTALRRTGALWYITLLRFLIIFSTAIPISLRVNIDWARLVYGHMIEQDAEIDAKVRNSSIPEELGRISFLLTDKTGTLTRNEMEMKKMHTGDMCYTPDFTQEVLALVTHPKSPADRSAKALVLAMCLCNNVVPCPEEGPFGMEYISSSPDEMAMVRWASRVGVVLWSRSPESVEVKMKTPGSGIERYKILHTIRFTSELKRMGVVVEHNGEFTLYMKGADSAMKALISPSDWTETNWVEEETESMAREGLRTMVFARRKVSQKEVDALLRENGSILEKGLDALGVTGVEDRLQDGVRITLEALRNAGIKIWMLTGDKIETAKCVALSSRLFGRSSSALTVTGVKTRSEAEKALRKIEKEKDFLAIDGESLRVLMDIYPVQFVSAASELVSVACCRCTPTQKAEITKAIHSVTQKRVCCIGDGGNDVSMIQQANVGIGIVGKEGRQAALAADFSISSFRALGDLVLYHGRNSYKNTAKLAQFIIHRGVTLCVAQGVFSSLFYFCPASIYQGKISIGYVTFYTFLPVFSIVLSRDVTRKVARKYPELYIDISNGSVMNSHTFSTWMLMGYYQGMVIMILSLLFFEKMLLRVVTITFSCLVLNELLMVFFCASRVHRLMALAQSVSLVVYLISFRVLSDELELPKERAQFFLRVLLVNLVAILPAVAQWLWKFWMSPPSYRKVA